MSKILSRNYSMVLVASAFALLGATGDGHAAKIILSLAIILLAAKIGGIVAERLSQPAVLGELIAGIVIGNLTLIGYSGLEYIQRDDVIFVLSEIGVVLLLFEVGLETNLEEMKKVGVSSILVAILGVVAPFALGWLVSSALIPEAGILVHAYVGAVLTATSVGITARVLKDSGKIRTSEGRIILGAAVIDDVLGLLVLAVMTGLITATNEGRTLDVLSIVRIAGTAFGFLVAVVIVGRYLLSRYGCALFREGVKTSLPSALMICFTLSYLASVAGLAPIVGAFAAGLIIESADYEETTPKEEKQMLEELMAPLTALFVPIFFVVMGARVDLRAFADSSVLAFAAAITVAAIIGKQVCSLGVLEKGIDRFAVGLGMIPRGEVGLIFAGIGLTMRLGDKPLVNASTYGAIVVMVILTTLITPPLLKWRLDRIR